MAPKCGHDAFHPGHTALTFCRGPLDPLVLFSPLCSFPSRFRLIARVPGVRGPTMQEDPIIADYPGVTSLGGRLIHGNLAMKRPVQLQDPINKPRGRRPSAAIIKEVLDITQVPFKIPTISCTYTLRQDLSASKVNQFSAVVDCAGRPAPSFPSSRVISSPARHYFINSP